MKNELIDKKYIKIFLVFLTLVIIGVTIFLVLKRNNEVEEGIKPSSIPNQAEIK